MAFQTKHYILEKDIIWDCNFVIILYLAHIWNGIQPLTQTS